MLGFGSSVFPMFTSTIGNTDEPKPNILTLDMHNTTPSVTLYQPTDGTSEMVSSSIQAKPRIGKPRTSRVAHRQKVGSINDVELNQQLQSKVINKQSMKKIKPLAIEHLQTQTYNTHFNTSRRDFKSTSQASFSMQSQRNTNVKS